MCSTSAFFFFQAEDGIRDVAVTGVQTCALPILVHRARQARLPRERPRGDQARRAVDPAVGRGAHLQHGGAPARVRSEEHTSELQSRLHLVCRLLLEKKKKQYILVLTLSASSVTA